MLAVGYDVRLSDFVWNVEILFEIVGKVVVVDFVWNVEILVEIEVNAVVVVVAKISSTKMITS